MPVSIFVFIFGCIIGSFLSVCIFRIPMSRFERGDEEPQEGDPKPPVLPAGIENVGISSPARSFCPSCGKKLEWWHNIPVVSWVLLRGRCGFCKAPISARYPIVELMSGCCALLTVHQYGITPTGFLIFAFAAALIVISFIDFDYYIIPNLISIPGTVLGIAIGLGNQFFHVFDPPFAASVTDSLLGILAGGGFLLFISEVYLRLRKIEGLGMGDVKLLAMTGAFFGAPGAIYTIFVGSCLGAILGVLGIVLLRRSANQQIPFGPYLAIATALFMYTGDLLVIWWARIMGMLLGV